MSKGGLVEHQNTKEQMTSFTGTPQRPHQCGEHLLSSHDEKAHENRVYVSMPFPMNGVFLKHTLLWLFTPFSSTDLSVACDVYTDFLLITEYCHPRTIPSFTKPTLVSSSPQCSPLSFKQHALHLPHRKYGDTSSLLTTYRPNYLITPYFVSSPSKQ